MNKEHNPKHMKMDDATHIGLVYDYTCTSRVRRPLTVKFHNTFKMVFTTPLNAQEVIRQHQTWLVETAEYWHIPGTPVKFSKIDGEEFVDNCNCGLMHYRFLQLDTVTKA